MGVSLIHSAKLWHVGLVGVNANSSGGCKPFACLRTYSVGQASTIRKRGTQTSENGIDPMFTEHRVTIMLHLDG